MACDPATTITAEDISGLNADIQTIDDVVDSPELTTTTKDGKVIDTLVGRLLKLGFQAPIAYAGGISFGVNDHTKTVEEAGIVYAPLPSALPFTTSGTFVGDDDARFYVIQQEIHYRLESIAVLRAQPAGFTPWIDIRGYAGVGTPGGGAFYWDGASSAADNGGTVIQPDSLPATGRWRRATPGPGFRLSLFDFGATGDGVTDDTAQVHSAVSSGLPMTVPGGAFLIDSLPSDTSVDLKGLFASTCILKISGSAADMINFDGAFDIKLHDLTIDCSAANTQMINGTSTTLSTDEWSLDIQNCIMDGSGIATSKHLIFCGGFRNFVRFRSNVLTGKTVRADPDDEQALLLLPDQGVVLGEQSPTWIEDNEFHGGIFGYRNAGTSRPAFPFHMHNNLFDNQICTAAHIYHGYAAFVTGNLFQNCQGELFKAVPNNIGGAVWLDQFGLTASTVYSDNQVRECVGVGIYVEELDGHLTGWSIDSITERTAGKEYTGSDGETTLGGMGIAITGGTTGLTITARIERCDFAGIILDRTLGVHSTGRIDGVIISNSTIQKNQKHGVVIRDQVRHMDILGGLIQENSQLLADTYDDIFITRTDVSASLSSLMVDNVHFRKQDTAVTSKYNINKDYSGAIISLHGCLLDAVTAYVNLITPTGVVRDNVCFNDKPFIYTGSSFLFDNNDGFVTKAMLELDVLASTTLAFNTDGTPNTTPPNPTLLLGNAGQSLNPNKILTTVEGNGSPFFTTASTGTGLANIRVWDASTGNVAASDSSVWVEIRTAHQVP